MRIERIERGKRSRPSVPTAWILARLRASFASGIMHSFFCSIASTASTDRLVRARYHPPRVSNAGHEGGWIPWAITRHSMQPFLTASTLASSSASARRFNAIGGISSMSRLCRRALPTSRFVSRAQVRNTSIGIPASDPTRLSTAHRKRTRSSSRASWGSIRRSCTRIRSRAGRSPASYPDASNSTMETRRRWMPLWNSFVALVVGLP